MSEALGGKKAVDTIQERLVDYACGLRYEHLTPEAVHTAKSRVIDTLGSLVGGFFGESCQLARNVAAELPDPDGASVIGTRMKTALDLAAFVNAVTARDAEMIDFYHWPGSFHGHPSDTLMPVLTVAEHTRVDGRTLITNVVLAYEVFCRFADVFKNHGFDPLNFATAGTAVASGKLMGLTRDQLAHCISMAVVPNNILSQVRRDHLSMFKVLASGQAARAGVFAAMLAREGMEGPHLPFEGKAGYCDHVAGARFKLDTLGGGKEPFKILHTQIKTLPAAAPALSSIMAAEKVAPVSFRSVRKVTVEVYGWAKERMGTGDHAFNPQSREDADHSVPYVVAATLMDGTITLRSFNDAHLWNPDLRALLQKIEVVENPEFTKAYEGSPIEHRTRVTVLMDSGERLVGEVGRAEDDIMIHPSDDLIDKKFRGLTEDALGAKRASALLQRLWKLEDMDNVAEIAPAFVLA